jgi:hypothetical protein
MIGERVSGPVIKLRCTTWGQLAAIYERDLKRAALFVRTSAALPLGREVRVDIIMPTGSVVAVEGRVAHVVPPGGGGRGPGLELVLTRLPPSGMWLIESALARAGGAQVAEGTGSERSVDDRLPDEQTARAEEELIAALEAELRAFAAMNPYQILGIAAGAGEPEARAAFAELSRRYHPDRFARFESGRAQRLASDVFVLLREAYRRIADAADRPRPAPRATPMRGTPIPPAIATRGTPARGASVPERPAPLPPPPPGPPRPAPPASPTSPPAAFATVTFRNTPPAPASGSGLDADYLFGDLAPPAAPAAAPLALDDPRLVKADEHVAAGHLDEALAVYDRLLADEPGHRAARAGRELVHGLRCIAAGEREKAALHLEAALEVEPWSERAARELAGLRRSATERGKGILSRLLGKGGT